MGKFHLKKVQTFLRIEAETEVLPLGGGSVWLENSSASLTPGPHSWAKQFVLGHAVALEILPTLLESRELKH